MTDATTSTSIVTAATYGPSNELLSITGNGGLQIESRTYNAMLQVTSLTAYSPGGGISYTYNYSSTQNNGKITSQTDNVSGEQVVYAYDALNRLASAGATSGSWGQSYTYDGFGNLMDQNVTAGSAPSYSVVPDPNTNHVGSVDANGNTLGTVDPNQDTVIYSASYDVENRFLGTAAVGGMVPGNYQYSYAPGNKRVWRGVFATIDGATALSTDEITFWGVNGQKLATYNITEGGGNGASNPPAIVFQMNVANFYLGTRLVGHYTSSFGLSITAADRLGSIGKYYPYGQEKPSATTNGTEKFTGYFRDSETGFDYADQRYHNPGTGRFLTPDPYNGSPTPVEPNTWNMYSYVGGDPINFVDPMGRLAESPGYCYANPGDPACGTCIIDGLEEDFDPICGDPGPEPLPPVAPPAKPKVTYFLVVTNDCYLVPANGGSVTREITYQLDYTSPGMPKPMFTNNGVIWEHLTSSTNTLPVSGANSPSSGPPGTFYDTQSIVGGPSYQQITQSFSAVIGGVNVGLAIDAPLFFTDPGSGGFGQSLNIQKYAGYVSINGKTGGQVDPTTGQLIPGTYKTCGN